MIDYFFGKPRTGKSYRAVKYIYDGYIRDLEKGIEPKFTNILTNIGGFKFDLINQLFLDHGSTSRAYKLVWQTFYSRLAKLYEMAKAEKSDDELNKYADYHHINDCLIVIDEASLYLKKYDDVLSWYFAYHGHFRVRIIIIAQSPKQICPEYMSHTEIFYDAQPQSKQLSNSSLRYIHYSDMPFSSTTKFSSSSIKTDQKIYNLYKSGEIDKPKKIIYKYIFIAIVAVIAIFFFFNLLFHNMNARVHKEDSKQSTSKGFSKNSSNSSSTNLINEDSNNSFSDFTFVSFSCFGDRCFNDRFRNVPLSFLKYLISKGNKSNFQEISYVTTAFSKYNLIISNDSLDLLSRSFSVVPVSSSSSVTSSNPTINSTLNSSEVIK